MNFICFLYLACGDPSASTRAPSAPTDGPSNGSVSQDKNSALCFSGLEAYQCGDDAFFVRALPTTGLCNTDRFVIDVAVAGRSKTDLAYKNILTDQDQDGADDLLVKSIAILDQKHKLMLGVADGVGGSGPLAAAYSSTLIKNIASCSEQSLKDMIGDVYKNTDKVASSTVCVAIIDENMHLKWANLGDSGLMVFRKNKCVYKTEAKNHDFNYPYQLGLHSNDSPDDCDCGAYPLEKGDVVLIHTDGMSDNVGEDELISLINPKHSAEEIARNIASRAIENSNNPNKPSPFQLKATAAGIAHRGGKKDDISIIVAVVR